MFGGINQDEFFSRLSSRRERLILCYRAFHTCSSSARANNFILAAFPGFLSGLVLFAHDKLLQSCPKHIILGENAGFIGIQLTSGGRIG